jgi:hypothetical protein
MNQHGRDAQAYWQRWLPARYAEIDDVDTFFTDLGKRVAERIEAAWDRLMIEDDPPEEERHTEREDRLAGLKIQAEIAVREAMVFLPAERIPPGSDNPAQNDATTGAQRGHQPDTDESTDPDGQRAETCAALIEGRLTVDDLSDEDLTDLIAYASPHFLLAVGTSLEEQRARGRSV